MSRRVVVTGAHALARGLAEGLHGRGDRVVMIAPDPPVSAGWPTVACDFASEAGVRDAVGQAVHLLGGLDQVVHTWLAPGLLESRSFAELDTTEWIDACEASLEGGWWLSRSLRAPLLASTRDEASSASVVFLVPTIAMAGAANYAMLATVAEGLRVLAKGCGRQWAKNGITVNTVAAAPHQWVAPDIGDALTKAFSLSVPAFGRPGDVSDDLAPLVALLASPDAHFLTAGTLVADGGLWMGL
jgi:NAD(P)-dependent dehydrogenase (short-subunit alcohol dehydrogenase family)